MNGLSQRGVGDWQDSTETWYGAVVEKERGEPSFYSQELDEGLRALCIFKLPGEGRVVHHIQRPTTRMACACLSCPETDPVIEWVSTEGLGYVVINPSDGWMDLSKRD